VLYTLKGETDNEPDPYIAAERDEGPEPGSTETFAAPNSRKARSAFTSRGNTPRSKSEEGASSSFISWFSSIPFKEKEEGAVLGGGRRVDAS
jgi:hypothetical protein